MAESLHSSLVRKAGSGWEQGDCITCVWHCSCCFHALSSPHVLRFPPLSYLPGEGEKGVVRKDGKLSLVYGWDHPS